MTRPGRALVVTGTDTGIGKTVFSAMLTLALDGRYWKPIQSGTEGPTDSQRVKEMTRLPRNRFLPERYVLAHPLSPHRAAELSGVSIDAAALKALPETEEPLVVETAGGLLVPITRHILQIELLAGWRAPVVLCARTALGTINHTLLSLEALKLREIPLLGVAFIGHANEDNERTICEMAGVRRLGRLPWLDALGPESLKRAFEENFSPAHFHRRRQILSA